MTKDAPKCGDIFNTSAISAACLNADWISWPYVPESVLQI